MNKAYDRWAASLVWLGLSLLILIFSSPSVRAQNDEPIPPPPQSDGGQNANADGMRRRDPLRALNLTYDQIQQIRAIREERKDEWRTIRQRLAEAHRALDEAIYTDNVNDALVEERAREVGLAQAAVASMRARTELQIRRLLTPEQLSTLRMMREQARTSDRPTRDRGIGLSPRRLRRERFGRRDGAPLPRDNFNSPAPRRAP